MKRKTKLHTLMIGALLSCSAPAFAIYKCDTAGKVVYSDVECAGGQALEIKAAPPADVQSAERQLQREKREAEQLARTRHKREAAAERQEQRAASAAAARQKRCATLAQRQKWAEEDAASAAGKAGEKARLKARRAAEAHLTECGRQDTLSLVR